MKQDIAVNRILRDLKLMEIIPSDTDGSIRPYLNALYVAGWDQGRLEVNQHGNKTIGQYDKRGKLFKTYKSRKEAAKITGFSEKGIYNSVISGKPLKGWTWKYLVLTDLNPSS